LGDFWVAQILPKRLRDRAVTVLRAEGLNEAVAAQLLGHTNMDDCALRGCALGEAVEAVALILGSACFPESVLAVEIEDGIEILLSDQIQQKERQMVLGQPVVRGGRQQPGLLRQPREGKLLAFFMA